MKITGDNLNEVLFENQDARLLIKDVVTHTQTVLYYYHDIEITVKAAMQIWNRANESEDLHTPYHVSLLDFSRAAKAAQACAGEL